MKVFELSKEFGVTNKELIDFLKSKGFKVSSHSQNLTDEMISIVRSDFSKQEITNIIDYIRKNISKVDQDKYVEFIIKYNKLNTYDKKELSLLRETLEYFSLGAKSTTNKINDLDLDKEEDIEKFSELRIYGQENLDPCILL